MESHPLLPQNPAFVNAVIAIEHRNQAETVRLKNAHLAYATCFNVCFISS